MLVRSPRHDELMALLTSDGATVRSEGGALTVIGVDAAHIGDLAAGHGIALHELSPQRASLEEAFFELTDESVEYHGADLTHAGRDHGDPPMTTAAPTTTETTPPDDTVTGIRRPGGRILPAVVRSEWTKIRSVRSTVWSLFATFGITVGLGALFCFAYVRRYDHLNIRQRLTFDPTVQSLRGLFLARVAIGVLGVLVISAEYATGLIRPAPDRGSTTPNPARGQSRCVRRGSRSSSA